MGKLPKIGNDMSLSEQAYVVIKDAILNNKFKPLEVLSEEALAAELGISRTPVRTALKKLSFERLLVINPGKNVLVADISEDDMSNIFPVRIALEPLAAGLASIKISEGQLRELSEMLDVQDEALRINDYNLYIQKEYEFHTTLARYSGNELLHDFIEKVNIQVQRFLILSETLHRYSAVALEEHWFVLKALAQNDKEAAEEMMRSHVVNVAARILGRDNIK